MGLEKENLIIKRFGAIDDINLDLTPIMVFIGGQATGKSTTAKLIAIFRAWKFILNSMTFEQLLVHYGISSYLSEDSYIKFTSALFDFEFLNGVGKIIEKEHEFHKKRSTYVEHKKKHNKSYPESSEEKPLLNRTAEIDLLLSTLDKEKDAKKIEELKNEREVKQNAINSIRIIDKAFTDYAGALFKAENYSEYIPAERTFLPSALGSFMNLQINKVPLPENLLYFGAEFEKARNNFKEKSFDIDILGVKYKYENNEDRIYISEKKYIHLKESSSGFQALIPLLLAIHYKTTSDIMPHTYIVEEPELNLFPSTQKELVRILIDKCTQLNAYSNTVNELVITTHSPYILTSLNNQLFANRTALKRLNKTEEIEKIIPKNFWIDAKNFSAYYFVAGGIKNIVNEKTGLIFETQLDRTSEEINCEYDALMNIYKGDNKEIRESKN